MVLALLLALGVGGGYAASWAMGGHPQAVGPAQPVTAASPSYPIDPVPELFPDPDFPPLETGVELVRQKVGRGDFRLSLDAPAGWTFSPNSLNEWQWRPPDFQTFGYYMRVEQVLSNRRSIDWTLDRRIAELNEDETAVKILSRTDGSLHYTYVTNNHLRHGFLTWLDLTGSDNAQVEVAVSGRKADVDGMADLIARVADSMVLGRGQRSS
jgi:hypothetical protein